MVNMTINKVPVSALAFGIASVLNDVKLERGLSGQEIADLTGLTPFQVSRWLNSRVDISVPDFLTLCAGLGLDPKVILDSARQRAHDYELRTSVAESTTPGDE